MLMDAIRSRDPNLFLRTSRLRYGTLYKRAIRKDPEERFESAEEMRRILLNIGQDSRLEENRNFFEGTTEPVLREKPKQPSLSQVTLLGRKATRRRSSNKSFAAVALALLLTGVLAATVWKTIQPATKDQTQQNEQQNQNTLANPPAVNSAGQGNSFANSPIVEPTRTTVQKNSNRSTENTRDRTVIQPDPQRKSVPANSKSRPKPSPTRDVTLDDLIREGKP
jgi:hypothetical protein